MARIRDRKTLVRFCGLMLALVGLAVPASLVTAQRDSVDGVQLRPGIVFHPTLNTAYVMTPNGIAAVDLKTGAKQWTSTAAAKPLALAGNLLISQVEPRVLSSRLELVALNTQARGEPTIRGASELPSNVKVAVSETLNGKFELFARPTATEVVVVWDFEPALLKGRDEEIDQRRLTTQILGRDVDVERRKLAISQSVTATSTSKGALELNLTRGTVRRIEVVPVLAMPPRPQLMVMQPEKIQGASESQYESTDGLHIMASERVGDDRVWQKYRWTVFERSTGRRLGEFRTHVSFSPFVVREGLLFYETTPYKRGTAAEEPAKLRAVNLGTGQEVWSVEVREIVYRGPFPP